MSALLVVAGMAVGACVGGSCGIVAALAWSNMEPCSFEPVGYVLGGAMAGAAVGAAVVAEVVL
jgi:hypothetical protein